MLNDRGLRYWLSAWIPVVLGAAVIALESTEGMGADHTSGLLHWLFQVIFGPISSARWEIVHILIRKSGHDFATLNWPTCARLIWPTLTH